MFSSRSLPEIESSIFKIPKQEGTFLKGSYFTFAVGTSKSNALFTSLYTFRIRLPNENYKELIPVESDQKAVCEIKGPARSRRGAYRAAAFDSGPEKYRLTDGTCGDIIK